MAICCCIWIGALMTSDCDGNSVQTILMDKERKSNVVKEAEEYGLCNREGFIHVG